MKLRIYTDTSVLGGCEDEEFAEHSVRLLEGLSRGSVSWSCPVSRSRNWRARQPRFAADSPPCRKRTSKCASLTPRLSVSAGGPPIPSADQRWNM